MSKQFINSRIGSGTGWKPQLSLPILLVSLLLSAPLLPLASLAQSGQNPPRILIVKSGNASVYNQVTDNLKQRLVPLCARPDSNCNLAEIHSLVSNESKPVYRQYDLVITLGLKARKYAAHRLQGSSTINAMIPRGSGSLKKTDKRLTVILDQPVQRSLRLIKLSLPKARRIGILISDSNLAIAQIVKVNAASLGLKNLTVIVEDETEIGKKLTQLLDQVDVLLALPDIKVHNRNSVSNILLSSYRKKVPVIGFSAAYVRAGAFAAVYSEPGDIARHLTDLADLYFKNNGIKPAVHDPKYFSVSFNSEVARSLGISPPDPTEIEDKLFRGRK